MPLSGLQFAIGVAMVIGLPVALVMLNRRRPRAGWWMLAAVVALIIIGNGIEKAVTGNSPLF
jgi:hypothetical protein